MIFKKISTALLGCTCIFSLAHAELITTVRFTEPEGTVRADERIQVWLTLTVEEGSDPLILDRNALAPDFGLPQRLVPTVGDLYRDYFEGSYVLEVGPVNVPFSNWDYFYPSYNYWPCGDASPLMYCGNGNYTYVPGRDRVGEAFDSRIYSSEGTFTLYPGESRDFLVISYEPYKGMAPPGTYEVLQAGLGFGFQGDVDDGWAYFGQSNLGQACESHSSSCTFKRTVIPVPGANSVVGIDVQPGDDDNYIETEGNYSDKVTVDIAGNDFFDASMIDPATLAFGPLGAGAFDAAGTIKDRNADGHDDLRVRFRVKDTGISCELQSPSVVEISGESFAGEAFSGAESIRTPECPSCHP